tara:strand:+ start:569 stop:841 length:273 start_codon:yes stop_codon:yes gene_type:complete
MTNSNINVTETEHPAQQHQQDVNACIHHIRDAVVDYVESEVLTPGEFVNCVRTALSDSINYHSQRAKLLKDAQDLLTNNITDKEFVQQQL